MGGVLVMKSMKAWTGIVMAGVLLASPMGSAQESGSAEKSSADQEAQAAKLGAQRELIEALTEHLESLRPVEGMEVRFAELLGQLASMLARCDRRVLLPQGCRFRLSSRRS